ncbi:MAG: hypothetical protein U9N49_12585 [Campylobacterota bacterium]|nr:hypothetical protein [Campylobacterota bacterium]
MKFLSKIVIVLFFIVISCLSAKDYIISVGKLPLYSESKDRGILIDVIKAMDEEYKEGRFIIEVYPFGRSIDNVITGKADLHFPTIGKNIWSKESDVYEKELLSKGIRRSSCSLTKTHFALYTNSSRPKIDTSKIQEYKIETDIGHTIFFDKNIQGTTCLACSVEKLSASRIDGLIFASREIDGIIKDGDYKNIRRQNFKIFGSKFILPSGEKGEEIDKLLSSLIATMIKNGKLKKVSKAYSSYFKEQYGNSYLPTLKDINE